MRIPVDLRGQTLINERLTMYAIIETGSKQYKVAVGDLFHAEKLDHHEGEEAVLNQVLAIQDQGLHVGNPYLPKAEVVCDVVKMLRGPKVIVFKFKRRKGYQRKTGHRQTLTLLKVKEIHLEGTRGERAKEQPHKKVAAPKAKVPTKRIAVKKVTRKKTAEKKVLKKK